MTSGNRRARWIFFFQSEPCPDTTFNPNLDTEQAKDSHGSRPRPKSRRLLTLAYWFPSNLSWSSCLLPLIISTRARDLVRSGQSRGVWALMGKGWFCALELNLQAGTAKCFRYLWKVMRETWPEFCGSRTLAGTLETVSAVTIHT